MSEESFSYIIRERSISQLTMLYLDSVARGFLKLDASYSCRIKLPSKVLYIKRPKGTKISFLASEFNITENRKF